MRPDACCAAATSSLRSVGRSPLPGAAAGDAKFEEAGPNGRRRFGSQPRPVGQALGPAFAEQIIEIRSSDANLTQASVPREAGAAPPRFSFAIPA
jgi:hypothetical protein